MFRVDGAEASEIIGSTVQLERHLQTYIERNMETLLDVRFLDTEVYTGPLHAGRIDSLGLDEDGSPVVIEYKRTRDENVINQALFYLSWLRDHPGDFEALVARRLGPDAVAEVDWTSPRIICIAAEFSRYDVHAVGEMNRRIDLVRYRRFGDDLLTLDLLASVAGGATRNDSGGLSSARPTVEQRLTAAPDDVRALYNDLDGRLLALGDVHSVQLKHYVSYRRGANFASAMVLSRDRALLVYLHLDPTGVDLEVGFTRDVTDVGHHGTGNLEVRIASSADLDRAEPLLRAAYEAVA
ncbi:MULTISPECIES: DUF5655 domain-containing protein [unclassified Kitasatospora]|uniref:DUF5655 domain-containing protein n=1 Tax=unclassified Kitasatospora TaxID=2633591 RepID=UPI00070A3D41|nr:MULTISPECIES: DUF5655 domain-containing protein [unclassified Kitasatospora]KQV20967.1 hypothetical protein ASC99_20930 [Kitasatospora sp. Root107]KRB60380.1 hypothetical protein ASE03_12245 [Kitasatospora sp. Root187]